MSDWLKDHDKTTVKLMDNYMNCMKPRLEETIDRLNKNKSYVSGDIIGLHCKVERGLLMEHMNIKDDNIVTNSNEKNN